MQKEFVVALRRCVLTVELAQGDDVVVGKNSMAFFIAGNLGIFDWAEISAVVFWKVRHRF